MTNPFTNKQPGAILTFGELMLRFSPDTGGQWLNNNTLPFYIAGAELNVATALALWGLPVRYCTAMPQNNISAEIISFLQGKNIDTGPVFYQDGRLGILYLTQGKDIKNNALVYDRENSAFAGLKTGVIDWDKLLQGVSWFHFSAICPALNQNIADVCKEALEAASAKNITISVDLNHRAKLWQYGKSPQQVMPGLLQHCNLVMGNVWAAETMLGIPVDADIHKTGQKDSYLQAALKTSEQIMEQYANCKAVANTFRFDATSDIKYYTTLYIDKLYTSGEYQTPYVIDRVGSGDCYMGGLIYGFYKGYTPAETVAFATAAAFEKLFINGDVTQRTVNEIKKAMKL